VKQRSLGHSGLTVSEIGFGTWGIGGNHQNAMGYGPTDDEQSKRALWRAYELGITFYDTANLYGYGHSEKLLGETLKSVRDKIIIASKAGFVDGTQNQDFSPKQISESLQNSLCRLQTDYLDVFQLHSPSIEDLKTHESIFKLLERSKAEGLIKAYGIAPRSPADALIFAEQFNPSSIQVNFNLTDLRALENGLFDLCEKRNIGIIVRTPLSFGFLTGKVNPSQSFQSGDHRNRFSENQKKLWADAAKLYETIFDPKASKVQNALRFCLSFKAVSSVIPGILKTDEVEENVKASDLPPFSDSELAAIRKIYQEHTFVESKA
jgi:aryl-alcohol dehydrogenase-like predicted oxidoreductase